MTNPSLGQLGVGYILLSRFNLYIPKFREMANLTDEKYLSWCSERVRLFRRFTLPSVLNQSNNPPFSWLIYFDTEINESISDLLVELKSYPFIIPSFIDLRGRSVGKDLMDQIRNDIHRVKPPHASRISTTRLDTDDAINKMFFHNLNDHLHRLSADRYGGLRVAVSFPLGAQYCNGKSNAYLYDKNPFISLVEQVDSKSVFDVSSVFSFAHYDVEAHANLYRAFVTLPQWLQVVHGANAANEFKSELPVLEDPRIYNWFSLEPGATF